MNRKPIIGVMGGSLADESTFRKAEKLGQLIAEKGWILLNGGRNSGVMEASAKGASNAGGITLGILLDMDLERASEYIQIPVVTGMGQARNVINVLSSDIVIACKGKTGTISEISLALGSGKKVILMDFDVGTVFSEYEKSKQLVRTNSPEQAIELVEKFLFSNS